MAIPSTSSSTGSVNKVTRKNITSLVLQDLNNVKFKKVQDILVKKYDTLKKKGSRYLPTFRNASNTLLFALRNYELGSNKVESIAQVKSSLKTISAVLREAAKE